MKSDHKILLNDIEPAIEDFEQKLGAEPTSTMPRKKEMTVNLPAQIKLIISVFYIYLTQINLNPKECTHPSN
jgi:hypothetical protein